MKQQPRVETVEEFKLRIAAIIRTKPEHIPIREVEAVVETMRAEHDPLASYIYVSRRHYRNIADTKGGKRREMNARLSFNTACELGFRGNLNEWERLMGAVASR